MSDEDAKLRQLEKRIMQGLLREGMVKTWYRDKPEGWTLASGMYSPFFINLRLISSASPELYRDVATAFGAKLKEIGHTADGKHRIVGIAMAGIPFANAVTLQQGIPSLYTRKLPEEVKTPEDVENYLKAHGQKALVEGEMRSGDTIVLVDDLVTRFDSKLLAFAQLQQEIAARKLKDVTVKDIVVLLDREQGGADKAREHGLNLHAIIKFKSDGLDLLKDTLSQTEYDVIKDYLDNPQKYQNAEEQMRLRKMAEAKA
jgi:uridine monophosphate synthetase